jgi:hypothetical protein
LTGSGGLFRSCRLCGKPSGCTAEEVGRFLREII